MYVISLQGSHLLHPGARKMCNDETTSDNHPSGEKGIGYMVHASFPILKNYEKHTKREKIDPNGLG